LQTRTQCDVKIRTRNGGPLCSGRRDGPLFSVDADAVVVANSGRTAYRTPFATCNDAIRKSGRNTVKAFG